GSGFNEKDIGKIFNRFYSNRPEKFGEHTGLGLNIVKNIIELHGGTINALNSTKGTGARININFPEYSV
ncbi:MAG: HAMP domain-containing histidine kinase, partial [Pelagibacteraceae bacterium]|nr:HAMP domain-containing histidine kinase [Pelagibacteraceae bacterium]